MFNYCTVNDVHAWLSGLDISEMPTTLDLIIEQQWIPWAKREIDRFVGENLDLTTTNEFYDGSGNNELILRHRPINFLRNVVLRIIPQVQWFQFKRWFHLNEINQTGIKVANRGGIDPVNDSQIPPYKFIDTDPVPDDLKTFKAVEVTAKFNNTTEQYEKADLHVDCRLGILKVPPRILFLENQAVPFWNYTWLRGTSNIEVEYDYGYKDLESLPSEIRAACAQLAAAAVLSNKGLFSGAGSVSLSMKGGSRSFGNALYGTHITTYLESAKQALTSHKRIRV